LDAANAIAVYRMDPGDGSLVLKSRVPVPGGPFSMAFRPDRSVLYVAQRKAKTISAFAVDRGTGALTLLNTVSAPDDPVTVMTDRTGRFLLSTYYGASRMAVHPIDMIGRVTAEPAENRATGANPHFILTDPSNRFLYVPNTGAAKILQFRFEAATGKVQPLSPPEIATAEGAGPRHVAFHGTRDIAYVVNEKNATVTAYAMDKDRGTLSTLQSLPTLPAGFTDSNACADLHLTPDNRFLYASNRGHQSLAGYKVDSAGNLAPNGFYPSQKSPRSFAIDPTGNYVFVGGQGSDSLASYRIHAATGALEPLQVIPTGGSPVWVLAVESKEAAMGLEKPDRAGPGQGNRRPGVVAGSRFYDLLGRESAGRFRFLGSVESVGRSPVPPLETWNHSPP
jgi:6-phosphogluconolactonase